jgi:putative endonuclease
VVNKTKFMQRGGYIYIMTNKYHSVLYIGVTNNLQRRIKEHKEKINPKSFTARYNIEKLVYYESFQDIGEAIFREKQLKAGSRQKKIDLIVSINKEWTDLYNSLLE